MQWTDEWFKFTRNTIDCAIVLRPGKTGQSYVRASNDQYAILWGKVKGYETYSQAAREDGSEV